jgi:hypothetical protein
MPVSLRDQVKEARTRWKLLTLYQKFEHAVILILTGLISLVVALAVWNLVLKSGQHHLQRLRHRLCRVSGAVRHDLYGHHRAGIQALAAGRS